MIIVCKKDKKGNPIPGTVREIGDCYLKSYLASDEWMVVPVGSSLASEAVKPVLKAQHAEKKGDVKPVFGPPSKMVAVSHEPPAEPANPAKPAEPAKGA